MTESPIRHDFQLISNLVERDSSVLDLGCGDGTLLKLLHDTKAARGYGVEISDANVLACVQNGINVIQNDLEGGLSTFESDSFDYVILSQTLQAVHQTEKSLPKCCASAARSSSPSQLRLLAHRWQIIAGRMPVSKTLPYQWYDTPNVHLCTINDFEDFCHWPRREDS